MKLSWLMSPLGLQAQDMREFHKPPHLELIAKKTIDLIFDRLPNKDILLVSVPPRHGKSTFLCVYLPSWYLMTHPHKNVILLSYSNELAEEFGRNIRDTISRWGKAINIHLNKRSRAAHRFHIQGHAGSFTAASIYGSYTGKGAHLLLVDDAVKELSDVISVTRRQRCFDTFRTCALSRLEPGGKVIIIMTRWSNEDLVGQILADPGLVERTEYIRIPALAEEHDPLGRLPGEPLWPERYSKEALLKIAESMGGVNSIWFQSLYQQNPPVSGKFGMLTSLARDKWLTRIVSTPMTAFFQHIRYWDLASTGGDFTASLRLSIDHSAKIAVITDMSIFRSTHIEDIINHIRNTIISDEPNTTQVFEQVSTSEHMVSLLRESFPQKNIIGDKVGHASKAERIAYAIQLITQNRLFVSKLVPTSRLEAWHEFISECHRISQGETPIHDDLLDAMSGACKIAITHFSSILLSGSPLIPETAPSEPVETKNRVYTTSHQRIITWRQAQTWPVDRCNIRHVFRPN